MKPRKICIVTGTRAEYGLLRWLMQDLQKDDFFELQIVASCMHLSPEYGLTYRHIESDGFHINAKVEMLLSSDSPAGTAKSTGLGIIGFTDTFSTLMPDLIVILGDRFEALAAAQTALILSIPIVHICGGDVTEGAFDDSIRHAITKMANLHFASSADAANRVKQLGENPQRVHNVGHIGLDAIHRLPLLSKGDLAAALDFRFQKQNCLVTFHPETRVNIPSDVAFSELLRSLENLGPEVGLIFTYPNSDPMGRRLIEMTEDFVKCHPNARAYVSLGQLNYLSALSHVDVVVGNSSSGLLEAPFFGKPTVNIGDRQKGRLRVESVLDCQASSGEISMALKRTLSVKNQKTSNNPYGDGHASERIMDCLKNIGDFKSLLAKAFFDLRN